MKVFGVNNIFFRGSSALQPESAPKFDKQNQVKELGYVTPDFGINTPTKYTKLSINTLDNGLELHNYKLANGYKVTIVPMSGSPAIVKSYVNVGSMNETPDIKGISHFLEHMAFNGTNGENGHIELKSGDSFKKIDILGGWANASTNYAITDYVNSTPLLENKDIETQIRVIASMAEDLKLSEDMIAKEKGPVSSEINMILDDPQTIAMDQTVRTLYNIKNPADELVGGSVKHIQNLTRQDVVNYYNKYYTPDNMNIVVTGDINPDEVIKLISKNFVSKKTSKGKKYEEKMQPIEKTVRKDFISDKAVSSQIVLGFLGPKNNDTKGKVLFDIAAAYLDSHDSCLKKNLKKYNSYPMIDSEKISTNPNMNRMAFITADTGDENTENVLKTLFSSILNIKPITKEDAERMKQRIKNAHEEAYQFSTIVNDCIGRSVLDNDMAYVTDYNKILDSITPDEVNNAVKEYFNLDKAAITVIHPDNKNIQETKNLTFKGKERTPIDFDSVSGFKLNNNNYDLAFYKTKTKNVDVQLNLHSEKPYSKKAGVTNVLAEIYQMGILGIEEDDFNNFKDKNNLSINAVSGTTGINITMSGDIKNYKLGLEKIKEILYHPNITEKTLAEAKKIIRDKLARIQDSANLLYREYDSAINPYAFTLKEAEDNLDNITLSDVKDLHDYILKNSRGIITSNLPNGSEDSVKEDLLDFSLSLNPVKPNIYSEIDVYKENTSPVILTKANNNSQADISQIFKFKVNDTLKERAVGRIMNSILSNSSIGLFNTLREKENLAYSVFSNINKVGNSGELSLNILTTTDNKNIGEIKYENVQKSINGFNRQINELLEGNFSYEDLESAKRLLKADLLDNEGASAKLSSLQNGLNSPFGIEYKNNIYKEIDNITKDDVIEFAKKVFSSKPIYSIVASQDTLDSNKEFFNELEAS